MIGSGSGLDNLFKGSSPLGDTTKYATTPNVGLACVMMKKACGVTLHVRHSERWSVISDCLVFNETLCS